MKAVIYILLAGVLTFASSYSLGGLLLRGLRLKLYKSEERFLAFISGSALLSTLVFLMTACGLARKGYFLAATLPIIAAAVWCRVYRATGEELPSPPVTWRVVFWALFAMFTWWYLGNAMAPETSPDGVAYHVGFPARYLREHRFPHITTNMYANLSAGIEMLFLYAISIGRFSAASLTHFLFLLSLPFGILSYARRIGRPRAGVIAALLFYLSPVVGRDGTCAYVDVGGAAVAFALFYALQIWRDRPTMGGAALVGILAGFGFGVKYTLGVGVIYALAMMLFRGWRNGRQTTWRPLAVAGLCAAALMSPWLIKNMVYAGNPVSPFLNRVFPNPYVYASFETGYVEFFRHMNGVSLREIPIEAAVKGGKLSGLTGPIFLLLPLSLFALRRKAGRQLLLAAAVFLIPYFNNIGTRFLIPVLPFAALALAIVLEEFRAVAPFVVAAHAVLSWPTVVSAYAGQYSWRLERSNWAAALRWIPEAEYLRSNRDDYDIVQVLEKEVPAGERVFTTALGNYTYHTRNLLGPFESRLGNRIYYMMFRATTDDLKTTARSRYSFAPTTSRRLRLVVTKPDTQPLQFSEVRIWNRGTEVPRSPAWRLRASINPWDLQLAFDNSPVTVWTVGDSTKPGTYIEIDFDRDQTFDAVTVDLPQAQRWAGMRVEAAESAGRWSTLAAEPTREDLPWPPRMRRAVVEEMKANGIHWLVFRDGELLADDLVERSNQWGIRQVAYSDRCRLWHLE